MNAKMIELKACFEDAGFSDVRTVLGSGNVVFTAAGARSEATLEGKAEAAMQKRLGKSFLTIVRRVDALRALLAADPYASFRVPAGAKRIVTFVRAMPKTRVSLPIEQDGARILHVEDGEIFSAYVPSLKGPVFMTIIKKNFGEALTTRTWDTVRKVAG